MHATPLDPASLNLYWSQPFIKANVFVLLNLLGALVLGMIVGYERTFRGRAAGMRTYGLVCMTSAALTVLVGLPGFWYGGSSTIDSGDPTRVIQGVVTGIGFLGAGVIMRDGLHVTGLTTAASIWTSAAIGILIGVGFYGAAILLALVCAVSMEWVRSFERWIPIHPVLSISIRFKPGFTPKRDDIASATAKMGYEVANDSICVGMSEGKVEWRFSAVGNTSRNGFIATHVADQIAGLHGVDSFTVTPHKG